MTMREVNGYMIRQRLQELELDLKALLDEMSNGLYVFEGEERRSPMLAAAEIRTTEAAIAGLQTAQQCYNLVVKVNVQGEEMTLCEAVKRVGGASRLEKMWRGMVAPKKDRYSSGPDMHRDKTQEFAKRSVTVEDAKQQASQAAQYASSLRAAAAVGNNTKIQLDVAYGLLREE